MSNTFVKNGFGWGAALWLVGYALSFAFFPFVPNAYLGWTIMPFGIIATVWVLKVKIDYFPISEYARLGVAWVLVALVLDYVFIVKLLAPADGYYKLDIYLYYLLTLLLPPVVGWYKKRYRRLYTP